MDAIAMLRNRVSAVTASLHDAVSESDGVDVATPVMPGTSPIGLTLWHLPRTIDWIVNTTIRDRREVIDDHLAGLPDPETYGFGACLTGEQARAAAAQVQLSALDAYADAVAEDVDTWLGGLIEPDLDAVPPLLERQQRRTFYATPESIAEVEHLDGLPVGTLLLRPAISHVLWHLGEIDLLLQLARAETS